MATTLVTIHSIEVPLPPFWLVVAMAYVIGVIAWIIAGQDMIMP